MQSIPERKGCPVCGATSVSVILNEPRVPVHCNLLWPSREAAIRAPRGDMRLMLCSNCTHIFNDAFDPTILEYGGSYENSLHFSPRFQHYAEGLVNELVDRYSLYRKSIIDIGCGRGEFLCMLCERGNNLGLGFDPAVSDEQKAMPGEKVRFVRDYYSERYASQKADFIISRQMLEHVNAPRKFLLQLRAAIGKRSDTIVFFEVPNADFIIKDLSIWDLIYEHYSYFNRTSLETLFRSCGFEVLRLEERFDGQFLSIEAVPAIMKPGHANGDVQRPDCSAYMPKLFREKYNSRKASCRSQIENLADSGLKSAVWGAGSKGVMYLNVNNNSWHIDTVLDINPRKSGMYIAGTGHSINGPDMLEEFHPDVIFVMNRVYISEIKTIIKRFEISASLIYV